MDPFLKLIPGDNPQSNLNRVLDVRENILRVRAEFRGKPEICHAIVSNIIHLRRDPDNWQHRALFWERLSKYEAVLLEHMDVRWLLSICDTIVDIGNSVQSSVAMNIVQCINRCNLDATLLLNCVDGRLDTSKLNTELKAPTWGGMITADVPTGDMIYNMQTRLDRVTKYDDQLRRIWLRIVELSKSEPNVVMSYITRASKVPHQRDFFL